jgi:hypothetical protein
MGRLGIHHEVGLDLSLARPPADVLSSLRAARIHVITLHHGPGAHKNNTIR